jgi:hypothetical protein
MHRYQYRIRRRLSILSLTIPLQNQCLNQFDSWSTLSSWTNRIEIQTEWYPSSSDFRSNSNLQALSPKFRSQKMVRFYNWIEIGGRRYISRFIQIFRSRREVGRLITQSFISTVDPDYHLEYLDINSLMGIFDSIASLALALPLKKTSSIARK